MFAGSCIGVVLLLIVLEGLRRAAREYDAFIIRRHYASASSVARPVTPSSSNSGSDNKNVVASTRDCASGATIAPMMPSFVQQLVRATLSMLQLVVAFIAMLLAMYFNGYIIISIVRSRRRAPTERRAAEADRCNVCSSSVVGLAPSSSAGIGLPRRKFRRAWGQTSRLTTGSGQQREQSFCCG